MFINAMMSCLVKLNGDGIGGVGGRGRLWEVVGGQGMAGRVEEGL